MKGLKLTRGVCCLLLLSVSDFPEGSTFLNRATRLLEDPGPEPLALDNKLCKKEKEKKDRFSALIIVRSSREKLAW